MSAMGVHTADVDRPRDRASADETLAGALGIRVDRPDPDAGGGAAVATFADGSAWSGDESTAGDEPVPVPTAALLALVDATARAAAEAAVGAPGRTTTLVPVATGVHFRALVHGPVTATASVPRDRDLADRADDRGALRFSVAVDVVGPGGARVAAGTVQWVARMGPCACDGGPAES